ncbi:hypothetical protein GCM10009821_26770 [Aeromicrobium halocynthiae]|uniref:Rhodanese domain-containing protein n=1 Tax=Aeromicrobium halocynthiae TaxID=560557 RepID=A0ABN2W6B1_9ACTN
MPNRSPRPVLRRPVVLVLATLVAVGALTACSGESVDVTDETVILDVRTPEEFVEGHLAGAQNIDVSADDFDERVTQLDTDAQVVVYCRSGIRSADAVERMEGLGFTDLTDAGGLQQASDATGLAIVAGQP